MSRNSKRGGRKEGRSAQRATAKQRKAKRLLASTVVAGSGRDDASPARRQVPSKDKKAWRIAVQQETLNMIQSGSVVSAAQLRRDVNGCVVVDLADLSRPHYVPVSAAEAAGGGSSDRAAGTAADEGPVGSGGGSRTSPRGSARRGGTSASGSSAAPATAPFDRAPLQVLGDDVGDAAARLHEERAPGDPLVCVLNMASQRNPGGGYKNGAAAQEEYLCRVSTLSACVEAARPLYPLPSYGGLYCPRVEVFRHNESTAYATRATNVPVAMACCAAVHRPETTRVPVTVLDAEADDAEAHPEDTRGGGAGGDGAGGGKREERGPYRIHAGQAYKLRLVGKEETEVRRRVVAMLELCRSRGHIDLVLGAWGCGAFRNPPNHVAEVFGQVLASKRFATAFRRVVFAVLDPPGCRFPNYKPFARAIGAANTRWKQRAAKKAARRARKQRASGDEAVTLADGAPLDPAADAASPRQRTTTAQDPGL